jgi:hypothetical protein
MTIVDDPHPIRPVDFSAIHDVLWFASFQCDQCGYISLGSSTFVLKKLYARYDAWDEVNAIKQYTSDQKKWIPVIARCHFDDQYTEIHWYPEKPLGKEFEDVPTDIASAASEAYACFSINANRAAVLLARTTVEAIAKDKGVSSGNLKAKIDTMAEQNIITDQLKDEAHEIRFLGNDMAHGDLGTPVDENDASDILGFLDTLLDYVYQQPIAIQKRRELREQRKQSTSPTA